ncbi:sugar phosphate isomerase/epimerase (plasmid) [Shinella sp. H4-D48]|jgi:sugar phosphate isomerase/epimerase|uniref:Sugar phosphate isomerase/epimerase n=1 Tax=Shinella sedimenti TaxID=2919913 RepID=A0ABT0CQF3_9HYPH|nr:MULTISPECIES: TIM barrel protein [Shinella]MCJ8150808.1 sugar phosphate isomerase/epimerase [Shinella sedimenti]UNK40067.1 sugar phosphate isomerase/epimerase [Shinella sp. H4-D48]
MKLGLGSYAFRWSIGIKDLRPAKPMTAMEVLEIAHQHGLSLVQYADNLPLDRLTAEDHLALKARADSYDMTLELGTQSFDAEELARYIPIGERIGSKILRVALDAEDALIPIPELAAQIRELLPDGKRAGLRFAIENHFNYPSPRMVALLDAVSDEALGVCLDVANSICAGEWPITTVKMLAPYTINLHLKDYDITPDPYGVGFGIHGTPLSEGRAEIEEILAMLTHCPDDMSVILEHWLPQSGDMEETRQMEHVWLGRTVAAAKRLVPGNHHA